MPLFVKQEALDALNEEITGLRVALQEAQSLRQADASNAKDILNGVKKELSEARRLVGTLTQEIEDLKASAVESLQRTQGEHDKELRRLHLELASSQEALNASRAALAAETTQHSSTRAELTREAQAHAGEASRHAALRGEHASLRKTHGDTLETLTKVRAQADAEVQAARDLIEKLNKRS